jgi:hypothetical protein
LGFGFSDAAAIAYFLDEAFEAEVGIGLEFYFGGVTGGEVDDLGFGDLEFGYEGGEVGNADAFGAGHLAYPYDALAGLYQQASNDTIYRSIHRSALVVDAGLLEVGFGGAEAVKGGLDAVSGAFELGLSDKEADTSRIPFGVANGFFLIELLGPHEVERVLEESSFLGGRVGLGRKVLRSGGFHSGLSLHEGYLVVIWTNRHEYLAHTDGIPLFDINLDHFP